MESQVSKTFSKVVGFAGSLMLTLFAGVFAYMALVALFFSIVEKDLINVIGCAASTFVAWTLWSVRKHPLQ